MRQILFGFLWAIVIYFVLCFFIGAVAGAIAGANDPQHASEAGARAGAQAVAGIRLHLFLGSIALGMAGAWMHFLPGTRRPAEDRT